MTCTIPGCDRPVNGHGLCTTHYMRQARQAERRRLAAAMAATVPLRCDDCLAVVVAAPAGLHPDVIHAAHTNHRRYCGNREETA
jgi:hypothetical protein